MAVHVFTFESWFMNRDEDWDCDCEYLVIRDNAIEMRQSGSGATYFRDKLRAEFPDAIWHKEALSLHRGKLESHGLEGLDEDVLTILRGRFAFKNDQALVAVAQ